MDECRLRNLLDEVRAGRLSRRAFFQTMLGLGLTAPLVGQILTGAGMAAAQSKPVFTPTKRGGGGLLKTLWWPAPTLLNSNFAPGTQDHGAAPIFCEPPALFSPHAHLAPTLAPTTPTLPH